MLQFTINSISIDDTLITTTFNKEETVEFDNGKILTPIVEFELDRSYEEIFETFWYKWRVTVFDTDTNKFIWDGRLVNIEKDDSKPTLKLTTVHYLDDTRQICNLSISNETPAEIVYQLLTDTTYGAGIPSEYIVYSGFQRAIAIQTAAGVYDSITYGEDSETEIKSIIEDICRTTSCKIHVRGLYIHFEQGQEYAGETGYQIKEHQILEKSFSYEFDDEQIVNKYYIAYNNSGSIAFATGEDEDSIATYGRKVFGVPEGTDLEESDPDEDAEILLQSEAAADWCGELAITLNKNLKQLGKITTPILLDYICLGDQIDLYFDEYINEPCKVTSKIVNYEKKQIKFGFYFLNRPVEIVERDITPPSAPYLHSITTTSCGIVVNFSQNQESDYVGNKIYFTSSNNYYGEYCTKGLSPVDVKTTTLVNGLLQVELNRLSPNANYNVYVTAYDSDRNESTPSNILTVTTESGYTILDEYEDLPIPEAVYTEYLETSNYLEWYAEREYTQIVTGLKGDTGEQGPQGPQGEPGVSGTGTPPVGSILPYLPGYFANSSNGSYTGVTLTLPDEFKLCDGSLCYDADSLIFTTSTGRYLPNLTDNRFLMGSTTAGATGGATSNTLTVNHIPQHSHTINHDHAAVTSGAGSSHNHTRAAHQHLNGIGTAYGTLQVYGSTTQGIKGEATGRIGESTFDPVYQGWTSGASSGNTGSEAAHTHSVNLPNYTGSSGNYGTASPTALENRPLYLSCKYIMRIK